MCKRRSRSESPASEASSSAPSETDGRRRLPASAGSGETGDDEGGKPVITGGSREASSAVGRLLRRPRRSSAGGDVTARTSSVDCDFSTATTSRSCPR